MLHLGRIRKNNHANGDTNGRKPPFETIVDALMQSI